MLLCFFPPRCVACSLSLHFSYSTRQMHFHFSIIPNNTSARRIVDLYVTMYQPDWLLQIDHAKKDYKFGFGLTVGEWAACRTCILVLLPPGHLVWWLVRKKPQGFPMQALYMSELIHGMEQLSLIGRGGGPLLFSNFLFSFLHESINSRLLRDFVAIR